MMHALLSTALPRVLGLGLALSLAGCGGFGGFGGGAAPETGAPQPSMFQRVFGTKAAETAPQPAATTPVVDAAGVAMHCPAASIRAGTEVLQSYDGNLQGDPMALRWQATVTFTERECRNMGAEVGFVVGVAGRVLLGPKGAPGTYTIPVRIALLRGGEQTLLSRLAHVTVTVPAGQTSVSFTHVEQNLLIQRAPTDNLANVQIIVGFDPAAPKAPGKKAKGKK